MARRNGYGTPAPVMAPSVYSAGSALPNLADGPTWLHFDSWSDFASCAARRGMKDILGGCYNDKSDVAQFGTRTFSESVTLSRTGWSEAAERIQRFSASLSQRIASQIIQPEARYGYEGLDFDIGRLMDGEPEHWVYWDEPEDGQTKTGNKIVRILYNRCASFGVRGEVLEAMGSAVAALVYLLDMAGYRAEVVVGSACESNNLHLETITVKRSSEDMDLAFMAYAVAHAACYRRSLWSVWSQIDRTYNAGHGYPSDFPAEVTSQYDVYLEKSYYDGESRWTDPKQAEAWVLDQLRALGVELRDTTC